MDYVKRDVMLRGIIVFNNVNEEEHNNFSI